MLKFLTTRKRMLINLALITALVLATLPAAALPQPVQAASEANLTISTLEKNYTFTTWIRDGRIFINLGGFKYNHSFQVKLKDAGKSLSPWIKLGILRIKKNTTITRVYVLPTALVLKRYIRVCLKDQTSNELICKTILNPAS